MEIEVVSELIEQYGTEVMIFCRRLTGCVPDAQDLYQQTFLKLMEMRVRIEREKNPRAFIFAVANSFTLEDPQRQQLAVDLQFEQGEWMRMQITQQTRDGRTLERESRVTSDETPSIFPWKVLKRGPSRCGFITMESAG